jgi:hypothetical protein
MLMYGCCSQTWRGAGLPDGSGVSPPRGPDPANKPNRAVCLFSRLSNSPVYTLYTLLLRIHFAMRASQSLYNRKRDLLYFVFFAIHGPLTLGTVLSDASIRFHR